LAAAALVWLWNFNKEIMTTVLALMMVVVIASLGRYAGMRINQRHIEKNEKESIVSPFMLQLYSLLFGSVVIVLAFAAAPKSDGEWRSQRLVDLVADIRDYYSYSSGGASGSGSFSMAEAGYGEPLGGDIKLKDDVVLKIDTEKPALLMGAIYDYYDGKSWRDTGDKGNFRFYSALWQGKKRQAYCLDKPLGGRKAYELFGKLISKVEMKITPYAGGGLFFAAAR
jgi:hypothetical protein